MLCEQHAHTESTIKIKHEQNDSKTKAGKEILTFISSIPIQMTAPTTTFCLRKESVNIKVQRRFLPFGGTDLLKVHATSILWSFNMRT